MIDAPETLSTRRLLLRQPQFADADAIFAYASDSEVVYFMDYRPRTEISDLVDYMNGHSARWNAGDFSWVITVKPDDRAVGTIACSVDAHVADFGYLLNRHHWGMGYATEAAIAVVHWISSQPEIYRVQATCDAENVASARVLEKCGLRYEGRLHCYTVRPNISAAPRDTLMYALATHRNIAEG